MENNNMNQNNQRGQMTRENKNNNGNNIKKVAIIAGITAVAVGGFFLVKKLCGNGKKKAQQADKDAE